MDIYELNRKRPFYIFVRLLEGNHRNTHNEIIRYVDGRLAAVIVYMYHKRMDKIDSKGNSGKWYPSMP